MRSILALLALLPLAISPSLADVITGKPDAAPAGYEEWVSPVVVPAPNVAGHGDWASAVADAKKLVSKMTLLEKVKNDTYPSTTMLDLIEELLTDEEIPAYVGFLQDRLRADQYPSIPMLKRLKDLVVG